MALEETGAEGVEEVKGTEAEAQPVDTPEASADAEKAEEQPPSLEELAVGMGWVPKEKFKGDESKWKPAHVFIKDGRDIQDRTTRELREVRTTLDTIKATNASIMGQRLREQEEQLKAKFEDAVAKGDPDEILKTSRELDGVVKAREDAGKPQRQAPLPETEDWIRKNAWFSPDSDKFDPVANERAVAICQQYAKAKLPIGEQLSKTEAIIRREFPHLFPAEDKGPAAVERPGSRSTAQTTSRGQTYADMPKEARAMADDLLDRGLIKDKEQYARNYFAQAAKGQ